MILLSASFGAAVANLRPVGLSSVLLLLGCLACARGGRADSSLPGSPTGQVGLFVDPLRLPGASAGYASRRISATNEKPTGPSEVGAFRIVCDYSHVLPDDPIVYPSQPGRSHSHTFFGNTAVNANSTSESIADSGNSTCRGGIINRSAYWVPTLVDVRDGAAVRPEESIFYYKTGYNGVRPGEVRPFPPGLRMVAGDATNSSPFGSFRFNCHGGQLKDKTFPDCPVGDDLVMEIFFPQCWDGVNLDSPDHKSHMAYPRGGCPGSHPVPLPEISFQIHYRVKQPGQVAHWRLSSDTYSGPPGYSAHGDWWNGWDQAVMERWVRHCNNPGMDCHAHLLGEGWQIF